MLQHYGMKHKEITDDDDRGAGIRRFLVWDGDEAEAVANDEHTEVVFPSDESPFAAGPKSDQQTIAEVAKAYGLSED